MTGLIWIIQLIQYPSYNYIDQKKFTAFQKFHTQTITFIVGPIMILELLTGILLLLQPKFSFTIVINLAGILVIWLCTLFFSIPLHSHLSHNYNSEKVQTLILTNWIRTLAWTIRSILLIVFLFKLNNFIVD